MLTCSRMQLMKAAPPLSKWGTPSKIVCVARNYSKDLTEKSSPIEKRFKAASIFMKPSSSLVSIYNPVALHGADDVVCETELALVISRRLPAYGVSPSDSELRDAIGGFAVALDLTKKNLQNDLKAQGKPWELAKGFDGACPISEFVYDSDWPTGITLHLNGEISLDQPLSDMILSPLQLLRLICKDISLLPGDVILTGTPTAPNAPPILTPGDQIVAVLDGAIKVTTTVV